MEQRQAGNYLWGCVFSPRDPRAKRLVNRVRIALRTPTASQLTWFWVAMGNTQGSRGFTFPGLTGKQARTAPSFAFLLLVLLQLFVWWRPPVQHARGPLSVAARSRAAVAAGCGLP